MVRQRCSEMLQVHRQGEEPLTAVKLRFIGVGDRDVYNITAPFWVQGQELLAGRVEARDSEWAETVFFHRTPKGWAPVADAPRFALQDPFVTWIGNTLVLGGVEVFPHPDRPESLGWRTRFYRGTHLKNLQPFAVGPDGMKDIRLHALTNGKIAVFTRPQGERGGRGTIGYIELTSLDEFSADAILTAPLLDQLPADEWGGANEIHSLADGWLGVLAHVAHFDSHGHRHYYPNVFGWHPASRSQTPMRIFAERSQFPPGPAKREDLWDVVFSGGLRRYDDGTAHFYAGISDAEAHLMLVKDPFLFLDFSISGQQSEQVSSGQRKQDQG